MPNQIVNANRRSYGVLTSVLAIVLLVSLGLTLWDFRPMQAQSQYPIAFNEFMSSNSQTIADEDGDFSDWIELVNGGDTAVSLTGYGLSDDPDQAFRWTFPEVVLGPGDYLLVWASGKNRTDPGNPLHTNFSIAAAGETLLLTHPVSGTLDQIEPVSLPGDISYGRQPDEHGPWLFFAEATPGMANTTPGYTELLSPPAFSQQGGFFTNPFSLTLSTDNPGVEIYYTLDGSLPDPQNLNGQTYTYKNQYPEAPGDPFGALLTDTYRSYYYSQPINIVDRTAVPDDLTHKSSTLHQTPFYFPDQPVFKGTVVRAMAVKPGALSSPVSTHTYFVAPDALTRYSLPVISLSIPEDALFDYEAGIYVAGTDFDSWRMAYPNAPLGCCPVANWQKDTEYAAHIELFETSEAPAALSQGVGVRIHGRSSRAYPFKSLRLYARSEYGESEFNYPIFPDLPYTNYKRLLLRNSGGDNGITMLRDATIQTMVSHLNFDTQAYRPALVFINGEYWGIHNIRERYDKYYLSQVYDVDPENIDLLEGSGEVEEGDALHYQDMLSYIAANGVQENPHYETIQTRMDVENYIDYQIAQIYIRNRDWPGSNITYWRNRTTPYDPGAPYGQDGRWRWMLYDTDSGFRQPDHNTLTAVSTGSQTSTFLFRSLLENESFKIDFINRFADLLNTTFLPARIIPIIEATSQHIAPEIPEHITRWQRPPSVFAWNQNVTVLVNFANQRPAYQRQHLRDRFGLAGEFSLTVDVSDAVQGYVRVNTLNILPSTVGINENPYPWTGIYFQGVPLELEAIALPGYRFAGWSGLPEGTPALTILDVTGETAVSLTAHFVEDDQSGPQLLHYWHFNDLPSGTLTAVAADHTLLGNATITYPGSGDGYMDRVNEGSTLNAHLDAPAGNALRVRNPADTRELLLALPTTGYEQVLLSFAVQRTTNGAQEQTLFYRTSQAGDWVQFGPPISITESFELFSFDFSAIADANNNPDLVIRILFGGTNASGSSGNNRFDNMVVEATPLGNVNLPPAATPIPLQEMIEADTALIIDLNTVFTDADGDELTYDVMSGDTAVVQTTLANQFLTLIPIQRGEAWITVTAHDGYNNPVTTTFRTLVYPAAYVLSGGPFTFNSWDPTQPERTYPEHMLFLQSDISDPTLNTPLLFPYYIPHDDYHADDSDVIGFPYNTTGRSRLNGLNEAGISFINTGRDRDLGGALLALDTRNTSLLYTEWLAGTLLQNSRVYAIRLQYRVGTTAPFTDILVDGQPVEYVRGADGDLHAFTAVPLPPDAQTQPYVQLLWRYYHLSGDSGPRAQLRLDDIVVYEDLSPTSTPTPTEPGVTPTHTATPTPTATPTVLPEPTPTLPPTNSGWQSPTANQAELTGDGNGFQIRAYHAHANDTESAFDPNSGTDGNTSCTSPTKDGHRFQGYTFSIPVDATITGIEVRLDAWVDSLVGAPFMCVQLSGDGGLTWTEPQTTTILGTTESSFVLGSPTDTWGQSWNPADLANGTLQVRIVNVATSISRDFSLDWVAVRVYYE